MAANGTVETHVLRFLTITVISQLTLFNEEDISTMFSMFDPTGKGYVSPEQYKQGESSHDTPFAENSLDPCLIYMCPL